MLFTYYVSITNHILKRHGVKYMIVNPETWIDISTPENRAYTAGLAEYCSNRLGVKIPSWVDTNCRLPKLYLTKHDKILIDSGMELDKLLSVAVPEFLKYNILIREVGNVA